MGINKNVMMHQIERYTADIYRCIGVVGKYLQVFFFLVTGFSLQCRLGNAVIRYIPVKRAPLSDKTGLRVQFMSNWEHP